jgi:hypothetical protein
MNSADYFEWQFTVSKPGRFELAAELAAVGASALEVACGAEKLTVKVPSTGDYKKFKRVNFGKLEIASTGKTTVTVKAVKSGWRPVNVRAIAMKPAK